MELIKKYVTKNMHYKNNKVITVKRLVLHSVGTPQPSPEVFIRQWDTTTNKYLAQMIVGVDSAYEVLPCTSTRGKAVFCWHVGNANSSSIGLEMTEPSTIKYTGGASWVDLNPEKTRAHVLQTYKNAVDIFAQLCVFHNLDPLLDGVILSHKECNSRGIGTAHADVEHIWNKFGLTMNQFRLDVKKAMSNDSAAVDTSNNVIKKGSLVGLSSDARYYNGKFIPEWVKKLNWYVSSISGDRVIIDKSEDGKYSINSPVNIKYVFLSTVGKKEFSVKVSIANLNIRTGPAISYPRIGYIPVGTYTIVETNGNWGKLKSKQTYQGKKVDGWISLTQVKKL